MVFGPKWAQKRPKRPKTAQNGHFLCFLGGQLFHPQKTLGKSPFWPRWAALGPFWAQKSPKFLHFTGIWGRRKITTIDKVFEQGRKPGKLQGFRPEMAPQTAPKQHKNGPKCPFYPGFWPSGGMRFWPSGGMRFGPRVA